MKTIQRIYERKTNAGYDVPEFYEPITDQHEVEHMLLNDMIAKHYWKALYIGSINRHNNYDGTCDYTVVYKDDGRIVGRAIYTVRER